jgi:hypothetical protein
MSSGQANRENQIEKWLRLLAEQTRHGNVKWHRRAGRWDFVAYFPSGNVSITSVDGDGLYPLLVEVVDEEGQPEGSWLLETAGPDSGFPAELAARIDGLWEAVRDAQGGSIITSMIDELEQMPPF